MIFKFCSINSGNWMPSWIIWEIRQSIKIISSPSKRKAISMMMSTLWSIDMRNKFRDWIELLLSCRKNSTQSNWKWLPWSISNKEYKKIWSLWSWLFHKLKHFEKKLKVKKQKSTKSAKVSFSTSVAAKPHLINLPES